jgi:hypothetical protein
MTSLHPQTHLVNSENVQLGLKFAQNKALAYELDEYAQFLTASLHKQTSVSARLIVRGSEVFSLIEVIARNRPKPEVRMEIEFWPDGMIVVRDQKFLSGEELGLTIPTAPIPVDAGDEYGNVDDLVRWLKGLNISNSIHRFVSAETLLREDNDRIGA